MTMKRAGLSIASAGFMTISIFIFMTMLLTHNDLPLDQDTKEWTIDIWPRLEEPEPKRKVIKKIPKPEIPPEMFKPDLVKVKTDHLDKIEGGVHKLLAEDLVHGEQSGELMPLYKPVPFYPLSARRNEVEGYVIVVLTVTPMGTVKDAKILYAEPAGYFERSALSAARKVRYNPSGVLGKGAELKDIRLKYSFRLDV